MHGRCTLCSQSTIVPNPNKVPAGKRNFEGAIYRCFINFHCKLYYIKRNPNPNRFLPGNSHLPSPGADLNGYARRNLLDAMYYKRWLLEPILDRKVCYQRVLLCWCCVEDPALPYAFPGFKLSLHFLTCDSGNPSPPSFEAPSTEVVLATLQPI